MAMANPGDAASAPLLLLGANGQLGRALLRALGSRPVRAVVRSERAANVLAEIPEATQLEIHVLDPRDEDALAQLGAGAAHWVNLVGILKETRRARYHDAHEALAHCVARAAARAAAKRIVALSILGATPASQNACLASRGRADEILLRARVPVTVLRLPMVLAPGERATRALAQRAARRVVWLPRGGASREQPLDARDAVTAMLRALDERSDDNFALDLAGPRSLSRAALLACIAKIAHAPAARRSCCRCHCSR